MANSFFNKTFKLAQTVSPVMANIVTANPAANYSIFSNITNWAVNTASGTCVEKPKPPVEEEVQLSPQPNREEEDAPLLEPIDLIIPRDDRQRPGINSSTTSVGRKVKMIDHNSYYAYNPNSEYDSVPWSEGMDPIRFLLGRLWTQNPPPHLLGTDSSLFGKSVIFGHKIMRREEDWVQKGDRRLKFFKDPVKLRDLRSGKIITDSEPHRDPSTRQDTSGKTSVFSETPKGSALLALKDYYKSLFDGMPNGEKPIFCDLAEYGTIKLTMDPAGMQSDLDISQSEMFRRLIFGGTRDFSDKTVQSHTFSDTLQFSPIGASGGLCKTISSQQLAHGTYSDHSFEMSTPITSVNLEHYAALRKPLVAKIEPVYNFYCVEYENLLLRQPALVIPEHSLPNIYTFMTEKYSEKLDYELSPSITNFLRLNPTLTKRTRSGEHPKDAIYGFFVDKVNIRGQKESETSTGRSYFKKWATSARDMIKRRTMEVFSSAHSNYKMQTFPYSEDRLYNGLKESKTAFPMFVDIDFSTDKLSPMADAISRAKLDCHLGCYLFDYEGQSIGDMEDQLATPATPLGLHKSEGYMGFLEAQEFILNDARNNRATVVSNLTANIVYPYPGGVALTTGRKCFDFEEWVRSLGSAPIEADNKMFFGESESLELLSGTRASTGDAINLLKVYLATKIKKLIQEDGNFRELEQVYNGKLCYNETLMYKVEKYRYDSQGTQTLVTQFLVPNRTEAEKIQLTDTQVKYDELYYYAIKSINLVVGNEYFFVFPGRNSSDGGIKGYNRRGLKRLFENSGVMKINYCNYPSVKIIEAPYFNEGSEVVLTRVMDKPPVPPMVKVDVYKGKTDRVLISLNSGIGDFVAKPITLNPSVDDVILSKVYENQRNEIKSIEKNDIPTDGLSKIRFRSDDIVRTFEIYRTQSRPYRYSDFSGSQHAFVDTFGKASSGSFIDAIEPNTKYYYTFRSIDSHGYFSNPSMVYEVEIVSADGLSYPIIRVYNPDESDVTPVEPTRDLNKFLEIRPNDADLLLNFEKSGLDGIKNMIQSKEDRNKRISSIFPQERSDFSMGSQYVLGNSESTTLCWGKKFKVRLTSKQSGKKLDLNIRFKYTDLVDPNDFYINRE